MTHPSPALEHLLAAAERPTPFLALDPAVAADRYQRLAALFPGAAVRYAVKACPHPAVLRALAGQGCGFDVASIGEIRLVLDAGAAPGVLCNGNPVRSRHDVAAAYTAGVRSWVTDSAEDLELLGEHAPGSRVLARLLVSDAGAATPFLGKFGATADEAVRLLRAAPGRGLEPAGVAFHTGSQQCHPASFATAVATALSVASRAGLSRPVLDVGGGFPVAYREPVPTLDAFATAIRAAVADAVTAGVVEQARLMLEPGRWIVAEAGVIRATVLRVSRRPGIDDRRWVYLDVGRYTGLAETENEAIAYAVRAPGRSGPAEAAVLSGPTCDGDDVLYRRRTCALPLTLRAGDALDLLATGAYTASYASVGFNGHAPLAVVLV